MLPKQIVDLSNDIEFQDYPTNTFYVDPVSRQIKSMEDGIAAMKQAIEIIMSTERYYWQIYSANFGVELKGLIGLDYGFITSEIKRRVEESFIPDIRITGIQDWKFEYKDNDVINCSLTVLTVYGSVQTEIGVTL